MQTSPYTNIASISYKHEDEEWAKWLQKKLEHYKLPTEIRNGICQEPSSCVLEDDNKMTKSKL